MISEDIKRAYAVYNLLDPEMKKVASEIAAKYPYNTEHVARIIHPAGNGIYAVCDDL